MSRAGERWMVAAALLVCLVCGLVLVFWVVPQSRALQAQIATLPPPKPEDYSPSEAFAQEQAEQERQTELERVRAELAEGNAQSRDEAMDRPPPTIVLAYKDIYGCEPRGWPPA